MNFTQQDIDHMFLAGKQHEALQNAIKSIDRYMSFASRSSLAVPGEIDAIRSDLVGLFEDQYQEEYTDEREV